MLIQQIMNDDTSSCRYALEADEQLKDMEEKYYAIIAKCSNDISFDLEAIVNGYIARVLRIAYLQGIKDFATLYITLKEDVHEILQKYE